MYNQNKKIDCHCHIGLGLRKRQESHELIKNMDDNGIDIAVICPVDEHISVSNFVGNNEVLEAVKAYPGRFFGMAVSNPWWGKSAIEELKRALGEGLIGLKINPSLQGHWANDEMLDPLIEVVKQYKGHVYIHSGTPDYSLPFEICELAMRHPNVNFIMGHSGFVDVFWDQAMASAERPGLNNIYFDISHICFVGEVANAIKKIGANRFVFGSDSPAGSLALELFKIQSLNLDDDDYNCIMSRNMCNILHI